MIREYRIVTDGERFRVQSRRRLGIGWCSWWGAWSTTARSVWPVFSPMEYATRAQAEQAIEHLRRQHARKDHGWQPVYDPRDPGWPPQPVTWSSLPTVPPNREIREGE